MSLEGKLKTLCLSALMLFNTSLNAPTTNNTNEFQKKEIKQINYEEAQKQFETQKIPVLMFHNIHENENRYTISPKNFKKLLKELYEDGFYSVSLKEYTKGNFSNVPVGRKPILLTFDDASTGQFMIKNNKICSNSAVGILEKFYEKNDFGRGGVFFVSFGEKNDFKLPFEQNELASKKMKKLIDLGYDLGHHTVHHPNNTNATKNNIYEQHTISSALFKYLLGNKKEEIEINSFAHPYGASPRNQEVFKKLKEKYEVIFDAWGGQSRHPLSKKYNQHKIPRIEITYQTRNLVLNKKNTYEVTPNTKKIYELMNTERKIARLEKSQNKIKTNSSLPLFKKNKDAIRECY